MFWFGFRLLLFWFCFRCTKTATFPAASEFFFPFSLPKPFSSSPFFFHFFLCPSGLFPSCFFLHLLLISLLCLVLILLLFFFISPLFFFHLLYFLCSWPIPFQTVFCLSQSFYCLMLFDVSSVLSVFACSCCWFFLKPMFAFMGFILFLFLCSFGGF